METSHKIKLCQAAGCSVDVATLGTTYNAKKTICGVHMRAASMCCRGKGDALFRYCQQCGKLEQLELFSGDSHSCRASLARRRSSRASSYNLRCQQQQQRDDSVADAAAPISKA
ncbi:hypothetical protein OEZ86_001237 [Tetradesmus obliquus]|nr:hypothetical protein OEZ86_001237 [Tetradesmus obliquus]